MTEDENADTERAKHDAERVERDVERVSQDVQRVEADVKRVSQDVEERVVQDDSRAEQDANRAQQDIDRGTQDQARTEADVARNEQDSDRGKYDEAIGTGLVTLTRQTERLDTNVRNLIGRVRTTEQTQTDIKNALAAIKKQESRNASQKNFNKLVGAVILLVLGIVIGFGVVIYKIDQNTQAIDKVQVRVSDKVLCPLYELFLGAISNPLAADSDRDGTITPAEQEKFDRSVKVIRDGYRELRCKPHVI